MKSLIIGFGKAGKDLHLHCLKKLSTIKKEQYLFDRLVGVVDPILSETQHKLTENVKMFSSLSEVDRFDPDDTVVHICTPPQQHLNTLKQVVEFGYEKIIIEKPLVTSMWEFEEICELQKIKAIDLIVIANWISSSLTKLLRKMHRSGKYGKLRKLVIQQHKARVSRTLNNAGGDTAFDIEMPHQVALALYMGGEDVKVVNSEFSDMHVGDKIIPCMGGAGMTLLHESGVCSTLQSNLMAPIRKRSIEMHFENYYMIGYYPSVGDDSYSQLKIYEKSGRLIESKIIEDDPLISCFTEYYRYFNGEICKPISDLSFNLKVVSVISEAKSICGVIAKDYSSLSI